MLYFAACHLPLSQQANGFQLLADSGLSKYSISFELICGVESRMLENTKIEPPMEIRAGGDNMLHGTAQGILLVVVRGTDDVSRKLKLPKVLVPGLRRSLFSSLASAQSGVKTFIKKNGSFLDLEPYNIQLTRLDNIDRLDLTIVKESRRTESAFCTTSGKMFDKETVLTDSVSTKPVGLSVGSINIDQRVIGNAPVEDKNNTSPYKIRHYTKEKVSVCEKVASNALPSTILILLIEKEGRVQKSALVSKRQVIVFIYN